MKKVAVEESLQNVRQALQDKGFEVVELAGDQVPECNCCVITGQDENVMGMQDVATNVPVINAHGLTADQILEEVQKRTEG